MQFPWPVRQLAKLALFTSFFFLLTFPLLTQFSTHAIGDGGDNLQFLGWQHITRHNLATNGWPFTDTTQWRYPDGFAFARNVDSYLFLGTGLLLRVVTANPVLIFNLSILLLFIANAWISYFVAKQFTKSRLLGVLASVMYGFSFYALARSGNHPNLLFVGGFPLFVWSFWQLLTDRVHPVRAIAITGLSVTIIALGSYQYLLMWLVAFIVGGTIGLVLYPQYLQKLVVTAQRHWWQLLAFIAFFSIIILIFGGGSYLYAILTGAFVQKHGTLADFTWWSPSLLDYLRPHQYLRTWHTNLFAHPDKIGIDHVVFVGYLELLLLPFIFISKQIKRKLKIWLGAMIGIFFIFSLGTYSPELGINLPYAWLVPHFPFWGIAESGRWYVIFYLFLTTGVILSLKKFVQTKQGKLLVIALIIGLLAERFTLQHFTARVAPTESEQELYQLISELDTNAVIDLPIDLTASPIANYYNTLPAYYQKPIVNGYLHWSVDTADTRTFLQKAGLYRFICENPDSLNLKYFDLTATDDLSEQQKQAKLATAMQRAGITAVVIHKNQQLYFPGCADVLNELQFSFPQQFELQPTGPFAQTITTRRTIDAATTYQFYVPQSGRITLQTLHYKAPEESNPVEFLTITRNQQPINSLQLQHEDVFEYGRNTRFSSPASNEANNEISVNAGDIITIKFNQSVAGEGFLNLTYLYKTNTVNQPRIEPNWNTPFQKIYHSDDHEVYLLEE